MQQQYPRTDRLILVVSSCYSVFCLNINKHHTHIHCKDVENSAYYNYQSNNVTFSTLLLSLHYERLCCRLHYVSCVILSLKKFHKFLSTYLQRLQIHIWAFCRPPYVIYRICFLFTRCSQIHAHLFHHYCVSFVNHTKYPIRASKRFVA